MHLIDSIRFVAGANVDSMLLQVSASRVVVLVGPNNAGKSLALREFVRCVETSSGGRVIEDVELNWPTTENEILELLRPFEYQIPPEYSDPSKTQKIFISRPGPNRRPHQSPTGDINKDSPRRWLQESKSRDVRDNVIGNHILKLDVRTRFQLMETQQTSNLQGPPVRE